MDGIFARIGLHGIPEGKNYLSLEKVLPFVASFINQSTKYDKNAHMPTVNTRKSGIDADVTRNVRQQNWDVKDVGMLETRVHEFNKMLSETFNEKRVHSLYTLSYHVLDRMVEDIKRIGNLSVLVSSPYERCNVQIKQAIKRTLQGKQIIMVEAVAVINRGYEKDL